MIWIITAVIVALVIAVGNARPERANSILCVLGGAVAGCVVAYVLVSSL
jgi:hypothetical protein